MVERLVLEVGEVEFVGDEPRGDVMREAVCPRTGGSARAPPPSSAGAYESPIPSAKWE